MYIAALELTNIAASNERPACLKTCTRWSCIASRFLPPVRAPAQHPSEAPTNRAIVLAPFYAYPLVQIGGGAAMEEVLLLRRLPSPSPWQLAANNYRICFGSKEERRLRGLMY